MSCGAVIVGAGLGVRLANERPKCMVRVEGIPLLLLAAWPFERVNGIAEIALVVPPGYEEEIAAACKTCRFKRANNVVAGGERRQDSVRTGLDTFDAAIDRVLVHDGARPLASVRLIRRMVNALDHHRAVTAALPVSDTLHRDEKGMAIPGPERSSLVAAQTPQGFERELLKRAFAEAEKSELVATDEVVLVREILGVSAALIPGEAGNIKITHPEELAFYQLQLRARAKQMKGQRA